LEKKAEEMGELFCVRKSGVYDIPEKVTVPVSFCFSESEQYLGNSNVSRINASKDVRKLCLDYPKA